MVEENSAEVPDVDGNGQILPPLAIDLDPPAPFSGYLDLKMEL